MTAKCGTCGAFQAGGKGQKGFCHLSPPAVLLAGVQPPRFPGGAAMPITVSARPNVTEDDWCCMWLKRGDPDDWQPSEPWQMPAPNPVGDIGTAAHPVQGIPAPAGFGTLLKPENRDPGSDTFVAKPIRVDHTESHKPVRSSLTGRWVCDVCEASEQDFSSTACLPPAEELTETPAD